MLSLWEALYEKQIENLKFCLTMAIHTANYNVLNHLRWKICNVGKQKVQRICPSRNSSFILYILILGKYVFFSLVLEVSHPSSEL